VDMKFEVTVIPVADVIARRRFTQSLVGSAHGTYALIDREPSSGVRGTRVSMCPHLGQV
jgi:hypothetical protein